MAKLLNRDMRPEQRKPIRTKAQMYELLRTGALGNTIPQFFSLGDWQNSPDYAKYDEWGVRVLRAGDPRMRLNVPRDKVTQYVATNFPDGNGFNISPMIDQWVIFKGEVCELDFSPFGWCMLATDTKGSWRESLRDHGKTFRGLKAQLALQHYCDPASYENIKTLLNLYPAHVVEFSVCDRNVGVIPGRNCVIWECRLY